MDSDRGVVHVSRSMHSAEGLVSALNVTSVNQAQGSGEHLQYSTFPIDLEISLIGKVDNG